MSIMMTVVKFVILLSFYSKVNRPSKYQQNEKAVQHLKMFRLDLF